MELDLDELVRKPMALEEAKKVSEVAVKIRDLMDEYDLHKPKPVAALLIGIAAAEVEMWEFDEQDYTTFFNVIAEISKMVSGQKSES